MIENTFHIMYEPSFYSSFFASFFQARFGRCHQFSGALILAPSNGSDEVEQKRALHTQLNGLRMLSRDQIDSVRAAYPDFSELSLDMIRAYGFPALSSIDVPRARFIESRLSDVPETIVGDLTAKGPSHLVFTFVNQIFRGRWISSNLKLVNAHPGVLPFARGVGALEQIAAQGDRKWFSEAAGATIHYIDKSIDAGPIIRIQRFVNPFSFETLSQLRAVNFGIAFHLMADLASALCSYSGSLPSGVCSVDAERYPLFRRADRTRELAERAANNFLAMKNGEM
jgi:phosphoribosylglycinamide formyltransferase-1